MRKIATLALIICSAFIFSACGPKKETENVSSVTPTSPPAEQKSTFSLKELLAKNIAQKCTWQTSVESGNGQGEIIISGNKFKQTVKVNGPMGETEFFGLSDGEWFYSWSKDSVTDNMAIKMKMDQVQGSDNQESSEFTKNQINFDEEFSYNCQPAVVNESDLVVPKDIKFTDFGEFMKQFQQ